jgi:hypothetical protein
MLLTFNIKETDVFNRVSVNERACSGLMQVHAKSERSKVDVMSRSCLAIQSVCCDEVISLRVLWLQRCSLPQRPHCINFVHTLYKFDTAYRINLYKVVQSLYYVAAGVLC